MRLYYKCNKLHDMITKKECNENIKCSSCQFKEHVVMNWTCNKLGLNIKKKITYCGEKKNVRCDGCEFRGFNFEADFPVNATRTA